MRGIRLCLANSAVSREVEGVARATPRGSQGPRRGDRAAPIGARVEPNPLEFRDSAWCPERDSNPHGCNPKDFTRRSRDFSLAWTISSPPWGAGRSSAGIIVGAHPASLCTFRGTSALRGLAQDYRAPASRRVGFPEFTRSIPARCRAGDPSLSRVPCVYQFHHPGRRPGLQIRAHSSISTDTVRGGVAKW